MYLVKVENGGMEWFLKRTTWTSQLERADKFDNEEQARQAAKKAEMFMAPKIKKSYRIVPA